MSDENELSKAEREAQTVLVLCAIRLGGVIVHGRYLPDVLALEARGQLTQAEKDRLRLRDGRKIFD
jgi:hypothetical protein